MILRDLAIRGGRKQRPIPDICAPPIRISRADCNFRRVRKRTLRVVLLSIHSVRAEPNKTRCLANLV